MNSIVRISSPMSEPWLAWVLLFLLLCYAVFNSREKGFVQNVFHGFTTQMGRNYGDSSSDFISLAVMNIFKVGVLALSFYFCLNSTSTFSFVGYSLVVGAVTAIVLLKRFTMQSILFVFEINRNIVPMEFYNGLWMLMCVVLYPLLLLLIHFDLHVVLLVLMCLFFAVYIGMLCVRLFRASVTKPTSVLYVLIYILTIEVLPIGGLFVGMKHFM